MRNYLIKICSVFCVAFVIGLYSISGLAQSDRDPFSPSGGNVIKTKSVTLDESDNRKAADPSNPLTASRLSAYKIIGTITSDKVKLAMVKSLSGVDYIVKPGDKMGSEGGEVSDISFKGVKVNINGSSSFLPVSNKIEVKIEE